jgi:glycine zipper 2TM protein
MKRIILAFAALGAVSACSDSRDRNIPVVEQPDRPLRVARPDTSDRAAPDIASRGNQPVSPIEQQAPRPPKRAAARPKPRVDTASARGYAPTTNTDTVTSSDTAIADTGSAQPADTTRAAEPATKPLPPPDTVATARTDTVPADTARASSDSAVASRATSTAPVKDASGIDDAARRTLPIGTEIHAALDDSISSRRDSAGRSITAEISESVTGAGGKVLIPAGSTVRLTVVQLASAKSKSSQGKLAFKVDGIEVGGGVQSVQADVRPVPRELRGRGVTSGDAAKVGVGAVGGAVLGRVIGGSTKGAVIGGVAGAAGGAVVASQTATRDVVVKAKTPITFVLSAPLVTP